MVGLGVGQTMRVVATNVGTAPPVTTPVAIPACGVDMKIFDSNGNQAGSGGHTNTLASETSLAVEQTGPATGRQEYRAQVQIVFPTSASNSGPVQLMVCNVVTSIQVYEIATGKTDFVLMGNPIVMDYIPGPPCQKGAVCPSGAASTTSGLEARP
jgi:hypothetical protein